MNAERWKKVSDALDHLLDQTQEARARYLDELRRDDPSMCADVESLLDQHISTKRLQSPPETLLDALPAAEPPTVMPPRLQPGQSFGPFRVEKALGQGGMGAVYKARDPRLDRDVALKVCIIPDRPQALDRFQREAKAAAALSHPHLCPVYEFDVRDGIAYIAMAFIEGPNLGQWAKQQALDLRGAALLVADLADAMQEVHDAGIIHRDLKPANVAINKKGEPVILDFGLARQVDNAQARLTQTGDGMGTPAYMAPEQAADAANVGPAADVYSLGVILYELLTGTVPFRASSTMALLMKVMNDAPDPPSRFNPAIPKELEALCLKTLAKKPEQRFASMRDFADELRRVANAQGGTPVRQARPIGAETTWAWLGRRRPTAPLRWIVLGVLLCGLATWGYLTRHNPKTNGKPDDPGHNPGQNPPTGAQGPAVIAWRDWLAKKTKEQILTVAQDGSGMYKTLGDAVDALKPGQVVKLLDKGPYREDLKKKLPEDVGIVSEVGTRLELPRWHKHFESEFKGTYFYHGVSLEVKRSARLAGLEIVGPEMEADHFYTALLMITNVDGDVVVEACRLLHRPAYPLEFPAADAFPSSFFTAVHVDGTPQKNGLFVLRNTLTHGSVVLSRFAVAPQATVIEENHIIGWRQVGIGLDSQRPGSVLIRNNVVQSNTHGVGIGPFWTDSGFPLQVTNNLLEQTSHPLDIAQYDPAAVKLNGHQLIPSRVRFQNNIIHSTNARGIGLIAEGQDVAKKSWRVGNNCYLLEPGGSMDLAKQATDLVRRDPFLSTDPKDLLQYRRIATDSPLARAGAGDDLPAYIGPFPPGPAPAAGDWFTRLLPDK